MKTGQRVFHNKVPWVLLGDRGGRRLWQVGEVVVDGDGGFQMNIQDVRRLGLPIKFFTSIDTAMLPSDRRNAAGLQPPDADATSVIPLVASAPVRRLK